MKHSNLIFGILLVAFLVSCKKTEMEENKEPSISSSHSYQRSYSVELAPFEKSSLENLINQTNIQRKSVAKSSDLETLSIGNSVVENNAGNYVSYSIALESDKQQNNRFHNLVIEKTPQKETAFLITYYPTKEYMNALKEGFADTPFDGSFELENIYYKQDGIDSNPLTICVTTFIAVNCTAGGNHTINQIEQCKGKGSQLPHWIQQTKCTYIRPNGGGNVPILDTDKEEPVHPNKHEEAVGNRAGGVPSDKKEPNYSHLTPSFECMNTDCSEIRAIDPMTITPVYETIAYWFSANIADWELQILNHNPDFKRDVISFLKKNVENRELAVLFAKDVIAFKMLYPKAKIDMDRSFLSPFKIITQNIKKETEAGKNFLHVYDKLIQTEAFKRLFVDIFGEESLYTVDFRIEPNVKKTSESGGAMATTTTNYTRDRSTTLPLEITNNLITITFDEESLKNLSYGATAFNIIHECVHANLSLMNIRERNVAVPLGYELSAETFADLLKERFQKNEHEFMATYYRPTMMENMKEVIPLLYSSVKLENVQNTPLYAGEEFLEDFSWTNFYEYVSWIGLRNTSLFHQNIGSSSFRNKLYRAYYNRLRQLGK